MRQRFEFPSEGRAQWPALLFLFALACKPVSVPQGPDDPQERRPRPSQVSDAGLELTEEPEAPAEVELRRRPAAAKVANRADALRAAVRGNPAGAIEWLRTELARKPADRELRLALARAHAHIGEVDAALALLAERADARLDPEVVALAVTLLRSRGELAQAERLINAALREHPDSLPLQGDRLALLVGTGRRDDPSARALIEALYDAYDAGKAKSPAELLAVATAALSRGGKGGFHDANMVLEAAELLEPADGGSWIGDRVRLLRGAVFLEKYAAHEATATFEMLLARDPWHPDALAGMAMVHVEELRFAAASRAATEALMVDPHHADAHAVLARIALIEGRRDEVQTHAQREALVRNPGHDRSLAVMAAAAIARGDESGYAAARDRVLADNPKNGGFFRDLSEILGFLHLYPEADVVLREGAARAPKDPYVQSALGLNLLRLGDEPAGRAALEAAWKGDPFNERTRNVLDLYEQRLDAHYGVETTGDLTLRLPTEDREFVQPGLVAAAQRSKQALDRLYNVAAGPLRLEFFASPEEFSVRTIGVPSLGAVAVCFGPVITFIGPYHGRVNLDLVMRHELAHVYAIRRSKGRVPRWFTEGLSEWESEQADPAWARESAELLIRARKLGKLRKLSELELAFIRAESPLMMEAAYATAAYAIRYLAATYGRGKLIEILDGFGAGETTAALFSKHLGKPIETVEHEFEAWFAAQLATKRSGWSPGDATAKDDPQAVLWRRAQAQAEAKELTLAARTLETLIAGGGDGFAPRMALAQLLLAGSHPSAAKRHLVAAQRFNPESTEPHVKLAELARRTGDAVEEKRVLREALAIDADAFDPAARYLMLAAATEDAGAFAFAADRVRALAPLHPIALASRAIVLAKAGKLELARTHLQRATKALENSRGRGPVDTSVVLALAHAAAGNDAAAKQLATSLPAAELAPVALARLKALRER